MGCTWWQQPGRSTPRGTVIRFGAADPQAEVARADEQSVDARDGRDCVRVLHGLRSLDLLTLFFLLRFTQKPFRFFGSIGTGMFFSGGLIVLILGIQRIMGHSLADRPMLVLGTLLMVLGIQTFSLGLIGELIIFSSAGGMKDYQVEDVLEIKAANAEITREGISSEVS